jgi:phage gpG-like protein
MAKNKIDIHNIDLLALATVIAKKYVYGFKEGFKEGGGMTDDSETGWKPSKKTEKEFHKRMSKNYESLEDVASGNFTWERRRSKYWKPNQKTLVDTGLLRHSIKATTITKDDVVIRVVGEAEKYAAIHNYGLNGKCYGHPFKMPRREFIGKSERINHRVLRWMKSEIKRQILNKR